MDSSDRIVDEKDQQLEDFILEDEMEGGGESQA